MKKDDMAFLVAHMGEKRRGLGGPTLRWEDNIKIESWGNRIWIGFIWHRIGTGGGLLRTRF
jgi:hypothetical protein